MKIFILTLAALVMLGSASAQQYDISTNRFTVTNYLTIGTNQMPVTTNSCRVDTKYFRYTGWLLNFQGVSDSSNGVLRLYARRTWNTTNTQWLSLTSTIVTVNVQGTNNQTVFIEPTADYLSGWLLDRYELTGSTDLSNVWFHPIQKGMLRDRGN